VFTGISPQHRDPAFRKLWREVQGSFARLADAGATVSDIFYWPIQKVGCQAGLKQASEAYFVDHRDSNIGVRSKNIPNRFVEVVCEIESQRPFRFSLANLLEPDGSFRIVSGIFADGL
jgi:hypothetical protein